MKQTTETLWLLLAVYWIIAARRTKTVRRRENPGATLLRIGILVAMFEFMLSDWAAIGFFGRRFVPASAGVAALGVAMTAAGVGLAIWARHSLAGNWSGAVTLKQGHELIRSGPYSRIRHPIYSGIQLALLGTALAVGQWRGLIAWVVVATAHMLKAGKEERWLASEFGTAFAEHRRRTGMFLPRVL